VTWVGDILFMEVRRRTPSWSVQGELFYSSPKQLPAFLPDCDAARSSEKPVRRYPSLGRALECVGAPKHGIGLLLEVKLVLATPLSHLSFSAGVGTSFRSGWNPDPAAASRGWQVTVLDHRPAATGQARPIIPPFGDRWSRGPARLGTGSDGAFLRWRLAQSSGGGSDQVGWAPGSIRRSKARSE